jgi:hypothetical protein
VGRVLTDCDVCVSSADARMHSSRAMTSEARGQRFTMARSLIQCGLVEQGENILRDLNQDGEAEGREEAPPRPRYLVRSTTAELFDNIFNASPGRLPLEGDLERERLNAMRETAKEVEAKWQTSVHATALQQTRDMWKLHHNSVEPAWGAPGGGAAAEVASVGAVKPISMLKTMRAWEQERQQSRERNRARAKEGRPDATPQRAASPPVMEQSSPPPTVGAAAAPMSPAGSFSLPHPTVDCQRLARASTLTRLLGHRLVHGRHGQEGAWTRPYIWGNFQKLVTSKEGVISAPIKTKCTLSAAQTSGS